MLKFEKKVRRQKVNYCKQEKYLLSSVIKNCNNPYFCGRTTCHWVNGSPKFLRTVFLRNVGSNPVMVRHSKRVPQIQRFDVKNHYHKFFQECFIKVLYSYNWQYVNTVERRLSETSIIRNAKYPNPHFLRSTFKKRKISDYFTQ